MTIEKQLAVISDIHGNSFALKAVLEDIHNRKIHTIVNLGDSLYGPLDPVNTAEILMDLTIPSVCGNEDRILLFHSEDELEKNSSLSYVMDLIDSKIRKWLNKLQKIIEYDNMVLFHGTPNNDSEYFFEKVTKHGVKIKKNEELESLISSFNQELILCGHSHIPRSIYLQRGQLIINPGSIGLPAYVDSTPYPHIMENGVPHARYCIITKNKNQWYIENISVPYNWKKAASIALMNGRSDWAKWLQYGRV
ncbi:MAG: metallophosphoesterase family protein [Promethearchaeota archaeon]